MPPYLARTISLEIIMMIFSIPYVRNGLRKNVAPTSCQNWRAVGPRSNISFIPCRDTVLT
jgi:hypothetical protein